MRTPITIVAAAIACAAAAAPGAQAAVTISSLSITPSSTQAGANPSVTVDAKFASPDGDTIKDATVSLPPGLLADPGAPTICSASDFQNQTCPGSSQIGDGTITGTAPAFNTTIKLPLEVYLIAAQGSELARIGVIADFFDSPAAVVSAPVQLRSSPTVGIDIPLTGIPNEISGTSVQISELSLTLYGTVNGHPFTRSPTSCAAADTRLTTDSYSSPTPVVADASFTPTGCDKLAYSPQLTATAAVDRGDNGVAFSATVTQHSGDSATSRLTMTLPSGLTPRLSALGHVCSASDLTTCPSIGTATAASPLLPGPLKGQLVLASGSGALPTIDAVFGPPLSLTLVGTLSLGSGGLKATFDGLPDVPITTLEVDFAGGANSILTAGASLCSQPQTLTGAFVAQSGATAQLTPEVSVNGCTGGSGGGTHETKPAGEPTATIKLAKLAGKRPKLTLTVTCGANAPALSRLGVTLPSGLRIDKRRSVTITLRRGTRSTTVTLTGPALKVARRLVKRLRHHHRVKLTVVLKIESGTAKATTLRLTATAR